MGGKNRERKEGSTQIPGFLIPGFFLEAGGSVWLNMVYWSI